MGIGKEALLVIPKHLHLERNPRTHKRVAHKISNDRRAFVQLITRLKDLSN